MTYDLDAPLDLSNVEEIKQIEAGHYKLRCSDIEVKETKKGDGAYIKAKFIPEGPYSPIYHMFNTWNPNETTRNIALAQIKTIAKINKHPNPEHVKPSELINMECVAKIKIEDRDGFEPQPKISYFMEDFPKKVKEKQAQSDDNIPDF